MTPLFKKLNYKPGTTVLCLNAPESFDHELNEMCKHGPVVTNDQEVNEIDFAIIFTTTLAEVRTYSQLVYPKLRGDAVLWFCYPKGTSKRYTCEFNRDTGWESLGALNLETVRSVSIDEDWTALRFRDPQYIKTMKRTTLPALSEAGRKRIAKK